MNVFTSGGAGGASRSETSATASSHAEVDLDASTPALVHDLRGVIGVARCLAVCALRSIERGEAGEAMNALALLDTSTLKGAALCGDILECSRRRARGDAVDLVRTDLDLVELAREQVALHRAVFAERRCEVELFAPGEPGAVLAWTHRRSLERVLSNLLQNAARYGAGRPVDVRVGASRRGAVLVVRDRGAGLPAEPPVQLGQPYQSGGERDASFEHFGLGMWIVRSLVESLGGSLHISSKPDLGTAITVVLPATSPAAILLEHDAPDDAAVDPSVDLPPAARAPSSAERSLRARWTSRRTTRRAPGRSRRLMKQRT